jgi:hypothetical protein
LSPFQTMRLLYMPCCSVLHKLSFSEQRLSIVLLQNCLFVNSPLAEPVSAVYHSVVAIIGLP